MTGPKSRPILFTIGHSNHSAAHFGEMLLTHRIEVLVDVRSWPHSRYVEWADASRLPAVAKGASAQYLFLGAELGGRPSGEEFYDAEGHVLYSRLARDESFLAGLDRLQHGLVRYRVAVMCSEENPAHCHRRLLVAKVLLEQGVEVVHIRGDGRTETEPGPIDLSEGLLFGDEESLWKSSLSVSRAPLRNASSAA